MKSEKDAYGQQLLAQYKNRGEETYEIIERDDGFIGSGSQAGDYFNDYTKWSKSEQKAINLAKGKILDVGCGAGRHSLYLQKKGFKVTGIDNSPGAIKVCKLRGIKDVKVMSIINVDKFKANSFDTIIMMGNNFGLFGNSNQAKKLLRKFYNITSNEASIIANNRNPYKTEDQQHLEYHKLNKKRGRMAGQLRIRVRFGKTIGAWFDYLFVSPKEMIDILENTGWKIDKFIDVNNPEYMAVIKKIKK